MRARLLATSFLLLVPAVSVSAAEEKKAPDPARIFARKDSNSDGTLSLDEYKAGLKDKALENADKRFKKIDNNGDGRLSLDEFKAGMPVKKQ